jgi:hypothetical protein
MIWCPFQRDPASLRQQLSDSKARRVADPRGPDATRDMLHFFRNQPSIERGGSFFATQKKALFTPVGRDQDSNGNPF